MISARERILADVRRALDREKPDPEAIAREAAGLIGEAEAVQPKFSDLSNLARFVERVTSERLTATVDHVRSMESVPGAVRDYLVRRTLPLDVSIVSAERLTSLDWAQVRVHHTVDANEPVCVGMAHYGIAETGTLVLESGRDTPTLFNFLPLHHVVVVEARSILRYMEDYWAELRVTGASHPRSINFITGTSGTADIEAKNVRGAHGPRFLHIIIVEGGDG